MPAMKFNTARGGKGGGNTTRRSNNAANSSRHMQPLQPNFTSSSSSRNSSQRNVWLSPEETPAACSEDVNGCPEPTAGGGAGSEAAVTQSTAPESREISQEPPEENGSRATLAPAPSIPVPSLPLGEVADAASLTSTPAGEVPPTAAESLKSPVLEASQRASASLPSSVNGAAELAQVPTHVPGTSAVTAGAAGSATGAGGSDVSAALTAIPASVESAPALVEDSPVVDAEKDIAATKLAAMQRARKDRREFEARKTEREVQRAELKAKTEESEQKLAAGVLGMQTRKEVRRNTNKHPHVNTVRIRPLLLGRSSQNNSPGASFLRP